MNRFSPLPPSRSSLEQPAQKTDRAPDLDREPAPDPEVEFDQGPVPAAAEEASAEPLRGEQVPAPDCKEREDHRAWRDLVSVGDSVRIPSRSEEIARDEGALSAALNERLPRDSMAVSPDSKAMAAQAKGAIPLPGFGADDKSLGHAKQVSQASGAVLAQASGRASFSSDPPTAAEPASELDGKARSAFLLPGRPVAPASERSAPVEDMKAPPGSAPESGPRYLQSGQCAEFTRLPVESSPLRPPKIEGAIVVGQSKGAVSQDLSLISPGFSGCSAFIAVDLDYGLTWIGHHDDGFAETGDPTLAREAENFRLLNPQMSPRFSPLLYLPRMCFGEFIDRAKGRKQVLLVEGEMGCERFDVLDQIKAYGVETLAPIVIATGQDIRSTFDIAFRPKTRQLFVRINKRGEGVKELLYEGLFGRSPFGRDEKGRTEKVATDQRMRQMLDDALHANSSRDYLNAIEILQANLNLESSDLPILLIGCRNFLLSPEPPENWYRTLQEQVLGLDPPLRDLDSLRQRLGDANDPKAKVHLLLGALAHRLAGIVDNWCFARRREEAAVASPSGASAIPVGGEVPSAVPPASTPAGIAQPPS